MRRWYPLLAVALALAGSAAVYGRLPERVPTHWNTAGEVDGYSSRLVGTLIGPAIMALVALLLPAVPRLDPKGASYEKFWPTYRLVVNTVLTVVLVLHGVMLAAMLGARPPVARIGAFCLGALLAVIGNVFPRVRPNWTFGIRTPWTLSSDAVWRRTHRVGGYLFLGAGVALMGAVLTLSHPAVSRATGIAIGAAAAGAVLFSYVAWRQERHP